MSNTLIYMMWAGATSSTVSMLVLWHRHRLKQLRLHYEVRMGFALFYVGGTERFVMRCRGCLELFTFNYPFYLALNKPRVYCPKCRFWHLAVVRAPPEALAELSEESLRAEGLQ